MLRNVSVLKGGVVSASPNPQAGGPPLVGCPRLVIQFIRGYPPCRRLFLYTYVVSAAVYVLKCVDHDLWKAGIEAGREQLHGLVQITPSHVSKVI